jgi:hypothetical protein
MNGNILTAIMHLTAVTLAEFKQDNEKIHTDTDENSRTKTHEGEDASLEGTLKSLPPQSITRYTRIII